MRPPCNEGFDTLSCSVAARGPPNDGQIHAVAVDCLFLFGIKIPFFHFKAIIRNIFVNFQFVLTSAKKKSKNRQVIQIKTVSKVIKGGYNI